MKSLRSSGQRGSPQSVGEAGFSLLEILAYTFVFGLLIAVIVGTLLTLNGSYHSIQSAQSIEATAEIALERMARDIHDANSVDAGQSTLNQSPGQLFLNTTDDAGAAMTVKFFLIGQTLHVQENGTDLGPLSPQGVRITNLIFRKITTAKSSAVKIEMTAESGTGKSFESRPLYTTAVLRGSYPL